MIRTTAKCCSIIVAVLLVQMPCVLAAEDAQSKVPPNWQLAAKTDTQEAYVDVDSIQPLGTLISAKARYEFASPQPWKKDMTFSSIKRVLRVDCAGQRIADLESRIFAQPNLQGKAVSKTSRTEKNLVWTSAVPPSVDGEVLAFICKAIGTSVTR